MLQHIIFDCDGVLVDSEPLSMRADVMILSRFGIEMSIEEAHSRFVGRTFQAMLDDMSTERGIIFPDGLQAEKDLKLEELYRQELQIVPAMREVLAEITARGVTCSVASNSPKRRVELALALTGISDHFQRIITFEQVPRGKPAPDVFLKAAADAGKALSDCLIVEDSVTGTIAAVAAGIRTIGFVGTYAHQADHALALRSAGAAATITHMNELLSHLTAQA